MAELDSADAVLFETLPAGEFCIGRITINAPAALNAVNLAMSRRILAQMQRWEQDERVVCVVFQARGDRAFCAGGDIRALYRSMLSQPGGPCDEAEAFFAVEYRQDYTIHQFSQPVIMWGNGYVFGGGLGIMAGGSHRVVTELTQAAMPEIAIGLFPDVGAGYFLNRMPGASGLFVGLTGVTLNAADCLYAGWGDIFLAHRQRDELLQRLLEQPWGHEPEHNHRCVNHVINQLAGEHSTPLPAEQLAPAMPAIESLCAAGDAREIVKAICDCDASDDWFCAARDNLRYGSPLAALVIARHLRECRGLTLGQVLQRDLVAATRGVRDGEFAEGIRALLIDKDRSPQWRYAHVDAVPDAAVDHYFQPPWPDNPLADLRGC